MSVSIQKPCNVFWVVCGVLCDYMYLSGGKVEVDRGPRCIAKREERSKEIWLKSKRG